MRDIVEEVLAEGDGEGTPPGEVQDVRVAVIGIGAAGAGRLTGIGRRLRDDAVSGQVPTDIDAVGVDLPGEETVVEDWEPTAWHVVESLARPEQPARDEHERHHLDPEETDRLRRFVTDRLDRYDVLVEAVDGTDPAAVGIASSLAAAFRGGIHQPVFAVPTIEADDPPARLLAAESGWLPDTRDRFGPDAVVPVERGRATEVVAGEGRDRGPLATDATTEPVERVAEDVTAALAEALGTRVQFGSLAEDLHHLRGRVLAHVGRDDGGPRIDADALAGDALATPVSDEPPEWRPGGAWLAHLRTPDPGDEDIDAAMEAAGRTLDAAEGDVGGRPATLRSYRLTERAPHELFLFRVEAPEEPDDEPLPHIDWNGTDRVDVDLGRESLADPEAAGDAEADDDAAGTGLDVVR